MISRFDLGLGTYTADQLASMPVTMNGGCPVVDLASNACKLGPNIVGCNAIQECDALTGASHFQYALPTFSTQGNPNPNLRIAPVGTPISNATFAPLMGNAPGLATSTPPASSQPSASQVSAAASQPVTYAGTVPVSSTPSSGSSPQGSASSSSPTSSSPTATGTDWLTQSMFGGIPNWGLLVGALALGWMFLGGRR